MTDDADKLKAGVLPSDPFEGATKLTPSERIEISAMAKRFPNGVQLSVNEVPVSSPADHQPSGIAKLKLSHHLSSSFTQWERRRRGDEKPIPTPWPALNAHINGGFWAGQSVVLAAESGSGKSQWAMQLSAHAAQQGHPVVLVQLEASESEVAARLVGSLAKVSWSNLLYGLASEGDMVKVREVMPQIERLPIYVNAVSPFDLDLATLPTMIAEAKASHGKTPLVILDYAQIAAMGRQAETRDNTTTVCRRVKEAALGADGALLTISAVSRTSADALRDFTGKASARSLVGVGRDTSEIEYSADILLTLCPGREPDGDERGVDVRLAIAKARGKGPSHVMLSFNGYRFASVD